MKLSLERKPGWVQVRAGRLRRVIGPHAVRTTNQSMFGTQRTYATDWVTAERGDLALEIVAVATSNTIGHTYISGKAIGLNGYSSSETWFDDAVALSADLVPLMEIGADRVAAGLMEVKHCAQGDLVVVNVVTSTDEESKMAMESILAMFSYEQVPGDLPPLLQTADVFFVIGRPARKTTVYTVHSQAPARAQDFCVPPFVMELAVRGAFPPMTFGAWDPADGSVTR